MELTVLSTDHWPIITLQLLGCIPTATLPALPSTALSPSLCCFVFPFSPNSPKQTSLQSLGLLKADWLKILSSLWTLIIINYKVDTLKIYTQQWTYINYKSIMRCLFVRGENVPGSRPGLTAKPVQGSILLAFSSSQNSWSSVQSNNGQQPFNATSDPILASSAEMKEHKPWLHFWQLSDKEV